MFFSVSLLLAGSALVYFNLLPSSPSMDFLTPMLSMECLEKRPGNPFSVSLLRYWAQECPRELAQLIGQLLCKQASATKKRK